MGGELIATAGEVAKLVREFGDTRVGQAITGVVVDAVGLLVGDWMGNVRVNHLAELSRRTHEILKGRGVEPLPAEGMSPVLLKPIVQAAADEGRPELQELWAKLMAAAMDPARVGRVRHSFVDAIKRMDPQDAKVMDYFSTRSSEDISLVDIMSDLNMRGDEADLSFDNLRALGLGETPRGPRDLIALTAKGRELLRVVTDQSSP
jgi:hypothetical protein